MFKTPAGWWPIVGRYTIKFLGDSHNPVWQYGISYEPTSKKGRGNTIAPWSQDSNLPLKFLTIREWESVLKAALVRLAGPNAGGFGPNNVGICGDIQLLTVERSPSCVRTTKHNKSECSMLAQMAYMPIKKGPSICKKIFIDVFQISIYGTDDHSLTVFLTMAHDSKRWRLFHIYVCW